ncbi:hypothetical protein ACS0TY_030566 [Phlomoides rotata]
MKPISPRPIFTLSFFTISNQKLISNSNFLSFSTQSHQNSYNPRRNDDESRAVRVSVWWDFENCNVPVNSSAFRVAQSITNAVRANGIRGPIQITAFGDVMQISRTNQEALSSTGINLTHVPSGGKNSADRSLLVDLMYWVSRNPPPAHIFLISGDRDFAGILHRLRMNNYNILLASPDSAPSVLCSASTIMWQWSSLLKGESLSGKLFNQPPDGPYHSWYGHFKAPLQDPFAITGQTSCLVVGKSCEVASDSNLLPIPKAVTEQSPCLGADESSDMKSRPIPKAVMRHIYRILKSNPEGIAISQLRTELNKISYSIDRELYGYKKFSRFLSAMPHILELQYGSDGVILVRSVNTKSLDEPVPAVNVEPETNNGEPEVNSISKTCDERSFSEDVTEKSAAHPAADPKLKAESTNVQEVGKEGKRNGSSLSTKMQAIKTEAHGANLQNLKKDESRKASILKSVTQEIHEQDRHVKLQNQAEKVEVAPPVVEKKEFSEKNESQLRGKDIHVKLQNQPEKVEGAPPVVEKKDVSEKNESQLLVPNDDHMYTFGFGIFRRIWMKLFGSRDTKCDDASNGKVIVPDKVEKNDETAKKLDINVGKKGETAGHLEVNSKRLEIFAEESFWKEMESFIDTSEGSAIFSKSRTRGRLVQNLLKQGPPILKSLSESDLLYLVELLISDKKWVEECNSRIFPFRLTRSDNNRPLSSNGLSHIFSGRQPPNQEPGERKHQNSPHTGVPQTITQRGSSSKSRSELLTNCQKVVGQIVKEHPEGFNIAGFRKLFLQRQGYALDLEKLGYDKLVNLLQIMPEVRIESNLILPAGAPKSFDSQSIAGQVVDSSTKDDDSDSSFDELGPAADNSGSEIEEITGKTPRGRAEQKVPDYEPLKEEDFSDSEEETSPPTRLENGSKAKLDGEESVLMVILDSWHSEKGGDSSKKKESTSSANVTTSEGIGSQPVVVNLPRKRKSGKSYSFVAEQPVDSNDKLVDGILGSLKKPSDKSADSKVLS